MVGCCMKTAVGSSLGLGSVLLIVGLVLGFRVFPDQVQQQVAQKVLLTEGSESWGLWEKLPIPMNFKVYFFNVTNVDDIHKGEKPIVQEVGPFVYDEYKEKVNIKIHEEYGTASYYQRTRFEFNEKLSYPLVESQMVTILHLGLVGVVESAEIVAENLLPTLNRDLSALFDTNNLFLTASVKDILFDGIRIYCDRTIMGPTICKTIMDQKPLTIKETPEGDLLFSLFGHKNNNFDGYYEVKLGWSYDGPYPSVEGAKTLGKIVSWENSTKLKTWAGEKCNELVGTDAAIFPPFLTQESRIDIFSTDLCRSLYAVYDREDNYKGVKSLRFTAEEYMLGDVNENPDNFCFCPEQNGCLYKGAIDLSACHGAPVILTFPHFYMASEEYLKTIVGVEPKREKHETFLELEPNTGIPLRGGKRVQFNMLMKTMEKVNLTYNVPTALFPIIWIDEGLELDDGNVNRLKEELVNILNILEGVKWGLIGVGIAFLCIGIGLGIFLLLKAKGGNVYLFVKSTAKGQRAEVH